MLDCLCMRSTGGQVSGIVRVNGRSISKARFRSISTYVPQVRPHASVLARRHSAAVDRCTYLVLLPCNCAHVPKVPLQSKFQTHLLFHARSHLSDDAVKTADSIFCSCMDVIKLSCMCPCACSPCLPSTKQQGSPHDIGLCMSCATSRRADSCAGGPLRAHAERVGDPGIHHRPAPA